MQMWVRVFVLSGLIFLAGQGCGRDEKSSADRDAEARKALQQGVQREQQMYQGMQKGVENLEKAAKEQQEKTK